MGPGRGQLFALLIGSLLGFSSAAALGEEAGESWQTTVSTDAPDNRSSREADSLPSPAPQDAPLGADARAVDRTPRIHPAPSSVGLREAFPLEPGLEAVGPLGEGPFAPPSSVERGAVATNPAATADKSSQGAGSAMSGPATAGPEPRAASTEPAAGAGERPDGIVAGDPMETGAVNAPAAASAVADSARLEGDDGRTLFRLGLTRGVTVEVFTLANPYRVVVDLPDVAFDLGHDVGRRGRGLVKAFRYGLFAEGKARIVLDVTGPVKIEKAGMVAGADGRRVELAVAIVPMEGASFGSGTGGNRTAAAAPQQGLKSASGPDDAAAAAAGRAGKRRPVVVIDPGHGGIDGGAVGGGRLLEKDVALSVGLELRRWLQATGRYDVRMTRQSDVFISLDRRLRICRDLDADLFISLHADSIEDTAAARNVRGATIYTLSERASDEQARLMAEKENASDLIAGIDVSEGDGDEQVKSILIDLMKRETSNFSAEFSRALVSRLRQAVPLSKDPERSAAFKVLKQTHSPAVLIELGYMTNEHDQKLLGSTDWRSKMARQITSAVDAYFARHAARAKD